VEALEVCGKIDGIGVAQFTEKDVVRHNLVQQIIRAYEEYDGSQPQRSGVGNGRLEPRADSGKDQVKESLPG
jgi:PhoH-like protein